MNAIGGIFLPENNTAPSSMKEAETSSNKEKVLVVDAVKFAALPAKKALITENTDEIINMILKNYFFIDRDIAESCDSVKQIIPYVMLRKADEIFILERLNKQTEKRLHGKHSIGIGGHINPDAAKSEDPIEYGLYRELHEETEIDSIDEIKYVGIINDSSTPVGSCHIGILYELWTSGGVRVLETEKMHGRWMGIGEIEDIYEYMETWSQIAINYVAQFETLEKNLEKT